MRVRAARSIAAAAAIVCGLAVPEAGTAAVDNGAGGAWSSPFNEGGPDAPVCTEEAQPGDGHDQIGLRANQTCLPAAGSMAVLGGSDVLYWNALEDTEEIETSIVAEFGVVSLNDQVRRMHVQGADGSQTTWSASTPGDGGANDAAPETGDDQRLDPALPPPLSSEETWNDGALFCSSLTYLPDGRLVAAGGTAYYHDPSIPGTKFGVSELEGLANTRIYDPTSNRWTQAGLMNKGRWYPTLVPLSDGRIFVASGVKRLIKTAYPDQAIDGGDPVDAATDSGRNVVETETFDPSSGAWTVNGEGGADAAENPASRSLPLYPRLHLLPDGRVYFNAAGQVFNPDGYAYDEVFWNNAAVYDPAAEAWSDLGVPGLDTAPATLPGFRGSTFSVMLPLRADESGRYTKAEFLTAGGILGTSPGTYFAVNDSRVEVVDTAGDTTALSSRATGDLTNARWYSTAVLTPTGEVIAFSGATADEVVGPGTAMPVTTPEVFDPSTETWRPLATARERRTYHNTAALLPDGRVLVGGHSPISTLYANNTTLLPGVTSPQETRNPTFEIFTPPYLAENRGPRPEIDHVAGTIRAGTTFDIVLKGTTKADDIASVVLMRRAAITHLVDGGQRSVILPITARNGNVVTVAMPSQGAVVPPGPYHVFANRTYAKGDVPSVGAPVSVVADGTAAARTPSSAPSAVGSSARTSKARTAVSPPLLDLERTAGVVRVDPEIAFHEIAELNSGRHDPHHAVSAAATGAELRHRDGDSPALLAAAALVLVVGWLFASRSVADQIGFGRHRRR